MKALKITLIVLASIIGLIFLIALVLPGDFAVERSITIEKPKEEVFDFILLLKNQSQYSKWEKMDPDMEHYYQGEDGTVGFISGWKGNDQVGTGEQQIMAIDHGNRIDYELRFIEPFESTSQAYMITKSLDENSTEVLWGFSGNMSFPMNLFLLFFNMEKAIGEDYDQGLAELKRILESN